MFKVTAVSITGFWNSKTAFCELKEDVNIIIGRNGTGKTTFMNILHAVLAVDTEVLSDNAFNTVKISLSDGKRTKTIRAERLEAKNSPFPLIKYQISNRRYIVSVFGADDHRTLSPSLRRRALEEAQSIRVELSRMVSIASLSVYRLRGDTDPEMRERVSRRNASAVDVRLAGLMSSLTQYQLELSTKARQISSELQRDVLISLLYSEEKASNAHRKMRFDEIAERQSLTLAYRQLGVSGQDITKKIQEHVTAISRNITTLKEWKSASETNAAVARPRIDLSALEAWKSTRTVVDMSLKAEEKTKAIFSQIDSFLETLKQFISDKKFGFDAGELTVKTEGTIPFAKLSSGEKQLLILFIEALLQRQQPYVFMADEPEISLHISWQRNIIAAIRKLNPNAQILVATHSPEIAGKFRDRLLDMDEILRD
jgi:ABC-type lipoprotein export system ATPase subunit